MCIKNQVCIMMFLLLVDVGISNPGNMTTYVVVLRGCV